MLLFPSERPGINGEDPPVDFLLVELMLLACKRETGATEKKALGCVLKARLVGIVTHTCSREVWRECIAKSSACLYSCICVECLDTLVEKALECELNCESKDEKDCIC